MSKMFMVDLQACTGCRICEVVCSFEKEKAVRPSKSRIRILKMDEYGMDVPVICQHCQSPPCVDVCPVNAIVRLEGESRVVLHQDRCIGCRACTFVCPYGAISIDVDTGKSIKCDACGGEPQCVKLCPKKALYYDDPEVINTLKRKGQMGFILKSYLKAQDCGGGSSDGSPWKQG